MAKSFRDFIAPYTVTNGKSFRLKDYQPGDTGGLGEEAAKEMLAEEVALLSELQQKLYAQDSWALLAILQGMDAAGKDGTIKHVMSGVNPQGCEVTSFRVPSEEDLDHDYLWRSSKVFPERGRIGIFNRSYYEEVLVVRVHPALLWKEKIPRTLVGKDIWTQRHEDIVALERYLNRNGICLRKFYLHLSHEEQRQRLLHRLEDPKRNWKFAASDAEERRYWDAYLEAYEDAIRNTATETAPWYVVPADHKWFTRLVVAGTLVQALEEMKLAFPTLDAKRRKDLDTFRVALEAEGKSKKA
ncbi:MAG: polyphosphate kinase 2 family protein [Myxococcaceae bacterium]